MKLKKDSTCKPSKRQRSLTAIKTGKWTVTEIIIHYKTDVLELQQVSSTEEAHNLIRMLWDKEKINMQEQFMAFFFNTSNKLLGYKLISTGTMKCCIVDVKLVCALALVSLSSVVIVAHNHPSGNLKPSQQDFVITTKIKEALKLIDVELLDHFILTETEYLSFAESGLM